MENFSSLAGALIANNAAIQVPDSGFVAGKNRLAPARSRGRFAYGGKCSDRSCQTQRRDSPNGEACDGAGQPQLNSVHANLAYSQRPGPFAIVAIQCSVLPFSRLQSRLCAAATGKFRLQRALALSSIPAQFQPANDLQPEDALRILGALLTLSSSGLGHRPFTAVTRVRIPLGSPPDGGEMTPSGRGGCLTFPADRNHSWQTFSDQL